MTIITSDHDSHQRRIGAILLSNLIKRGKWFWEFEISKGGFMRIRVYLPAGGYAVPFVYVVDGKQGVAIAAGGGNRKETSSGDTFIAFSLPNEKK